jgi:predicted lipoprotein with Yx(FWY)xxD motif
MACGSDDPEPAATAPPATSSAATASPATAAPATAAPGTAAPATAAPDTVPMGGLDYGYPASGSADTAAAADTTTPAGAGTEALVEIAESDLGQILVTDGVTLYVFTPDEGAAAPTCEGGCADAWPPLIANGDVTVGDGLDQAKFGTVTRGDGGEQVTFDGWPLYRVASDAAPGDTNGQGVGGKWYVVAPDGTVVRN